MAQRNHRVVDNPAELHECLRAFKFEAGVADLTACKVTKLKAVLQGLEASPATTSR